MSEPSSEAAASARNVPTLRDAKNLFLISLILVAIVGGPVQNYNFWIGLSLTEIMFILLPTVAFVAKGKFSPRLVLRLNYPGSVSLLVGVVLGLCIWPFGLWIETSLRALFSAQGHGILNALSNVGRVNMLYRLLVMGMLAASCEEILFRGYLQSAVENKLGAKQGVLWTAILFSVYHLVPIRMVAILPGAFVMSWVCWKFNSIFPAMLVHFSNNFLAPYLYLHYGRNTFGWFHVTMAGAAVVAGLTVFITTKSKAHSRPYGG